MQRYEDDEDSSAMEDFLASSPPAWNADIPRPEHDEEDDWDDDVDGEIQDIPNAHFDVLNSSLPGYGGLHICMKLTTAVDPQSSAERAARSLLRDLPARPDKPLQKPKWHFGIRSRSPPMEVMLEIYRTLNILGMQWRSKEEILLPEIGPAPPGGYTDEVESSLEQWAQDHGETPTMGKKNPGKKDVAALSKAATGLFFVETRARYGNVMVSTPDECSDT